MYKILATKSSLLPFSSHMYIYADDCTCQQINFFFVVVNNAVMGAVVLALYIADGHLVVI